MTADPSDHSLLIRLDERVKQLRESTDAGFEHVDKRFEEAERNIVLAREQYPTREDITKGLEQARTESRDIAREEAARSYERAATESKSQADKAEMALKNLAEQTARSQQAIAAQTERTQETLSEQLKAFRGEMLDKIEEAKSNRSLVTAIAALGGLAGVGGVVYAIATG